MFFASLGRQSLCGTRLLSPWCECDIPARNNTLTNKETVVAHNEADRLRQLCLGSEPTGARDVCNGQRSRACAAVVAVQHRDVVCRVLPLSSAVQAAET